MTSNAVILYRSQHIINGFINGFAGAGWRFHQVSVRILPFVIGLSVMVKVAAGEMVSIVSEGRFF